MRRLQIAEMNARYGNREVVHDIYLGLDDGEIGCLLGPSGCGKTTVLRAIAGFVPPSRGTITIRGTTVYDATTSVPPEQRDVGMVFQDYALFPHLSTADNIAFGLRHWEETKRTERVTELLDFVGMSDHRESYPHQLSGGEQQRVALVRAMAPRPSLMLLDEPFSSMDVALRTQLASEVRRILKAENVTALMVTHDQHEAFAMADRVAVMHEGRIHQQDRPYNLYHHPANRLVADFIGEGVFLAGRITSDRAVETALGRLPGTPSHEFATGSKVDVLVRPDDVICHESVGHSAVVTDRDFRGASYLYSLTTETGVALLSVAPSHQHFEIGASIKVQLDLQHLTVYRGD